MALLDTPDDAQASSEGDGQDSSEPPNSDRKPFIASQSPPESSHRNAVAMPMPPARFLEKDLQPHPLANGHPSPTQPKTSSSSFSAGLTSHFPGPGNSHPPSHPPLPH